MWKRNSNKKNKKKKAHMRGVRVAVNFVLEVKIAVAYTCSSEIGHSPVSQWGLSADEWSQWLWEIDEAAGASWVSVVCLQLQKKKKKMLCSTSVATSVQEMNMGRPCGAPTQPRLHVSVPWGFCFLHRLWSICRSCTIMVQKCHRLRKLQFTSFPLECVTFLQLPYLRVSQVL